MCHLSCVEYWGNSLFDLKQLIMTRLGCELLSDFQARAALSSQLLCALFLTWNENPSTCEILSPKLTLKNMGRPDRHDNSCFRCYQHSSCVGSFFVLTFIDMISVQRNAPSCHHVPFPRRWSQGHPGATSGNVYPQIKAVPVGGVEANDNIVVPAGFFFF